MKAFPQKYPTDPSKPWVTNENPIDTGMELRDYFAAKAVQGLLSHDGEYAITHVEEDTQYIALNFFAKQAYKVADAMMEARNGTV